jgi:uncharacterized protein YndB with AHSA1/START domain
MTTMSDLRIEREVVIEAPAEVVWRTITEPDQIVRWFADRVELETTPGGRGTFIFENPGGATHTAALVVETVEPPARFSFRWGQPQGDEPVTGNSVLVEFTLMPEGDERTRLQVTESGLDLLGWSDGDKDQYAEDHRNGWGTFLGRLSGLLANQPSGHRHD